MPALTAKSIQALQPPASGRIEIHDDLVPGLILRVSANGSRIWSVQTRINGHKRRITIGSFPAAGLKEARNEAERLKVAARTGTLDQAQRRTSPSTSKRVRKPRTKQSHTVAEVITAHADQHLARLNTARQREAMLRNNLKHFATVPIDQLTSRDLQRVIDEKARFGLGVSANRLRSALIKFTKWSFMRGYLPNDIGQATEKPVRERPRERVLSVDEVRTIYAAALDLGPFWVDFVRLLLLTAQRRGDVAKMRCCDINLETARWLQPGRKTKNGKAHIVPLSAPCLAILSRLTNGRRGFDELVFTSTGHTPYSGFSKLLKRLDDCVTAARLRQGVPYYEAQLEPWRLHDFRTAFATHMAERGAAADVVDRVLNHAASASAASTVARVYNRAELLPQRAAVLEAWAELVTDDESA